MEQYLGKRLRLVVVGGDRFEGVLTELAGDDWITVDCGKEGIWHIDFTAIAAYSIME